MAATFDLVTGARLWSAENAFDFIGGALDGTTASDGASWVDPVVGAKFKADISQDIYIAGWGLAGGFGVSSAPFERHDVAVCRVSPAA